MLCTCTLILVPLLLPCKTISGRLNRINALDKQFTIKYRQWSKTDQLPLLPEVTEYIISLTYFDSFHSTTQIYIYHKEKETKGWKNDSHAIVHI